MRFVSSPGGLVAATLFSVACVLPCFNVPHVFAQEEVAEVVPIGEEQEPISVANTDFSITPVVANEKAKARDIIKKELVVTNNTKQRLDLYITVENIDPTDGALETLSPGVADLSVSLANWIEITRGVIELGPEESRKIPYLIHVNLSAKPASYFARIVFSQGSVRSEAEAKKAEDGTSLMLNVEVMDDAKERLQLGNFLSSDSIVLGKDVSFSYLLENVGNRVVEPRGSIRIFNRRGEEVGSIPLNVNGEQISPENTKQLAATWNAASRFGKYKAFLDLEYGENQLASVQDTVYFWIFPWKEILMSLFGVMVLAMVGTFTLHMRSLARPVHVHAPAPIPVAASPVHAYRAPSYEEPQESTRLSQRLPKRENYAQSASVRQAPSMERPRTSGATVELGTRQKVVQSHGSTIELARRK